MYDFVFALMHINPFLKRVYFKKTEHASATGTLNTNNKTDLYNFDPLKPHFYKVKLGPTGVYIIFLITAQKHRL